MVGHVKQAQEMLALWEEFKSIGLPDNRWEEFYTEKTAARQGRLTKRAPKRDKEGKVFDPGERPGAAANKGGETCV